MNSSPDNPLLKLRFRATGEIFYAVKWLGATPLVHGKHFCYPGDYILAPTEESLSYNIDHGFGRYVHAAELDQEYDRL